MKFSYLSLSFLGVILLLLPSISYALPLPEFASAAFGIGELVAIGLGLITLIFPFIKKIKFKNSIPISLFLLLSLAINLQYWQKDTSFTNVVDDRDEHPNMIWTEQERNNDPYAIDELVAYNILKQQEQLGSHHYFFLDARTRSETELGTASGFTKYNWADLATNYKEALKDKTVIATCWTGMRGSEICSKLRALGINCRYLKGGLDAWVKLNLPLNLNINVKKSEFGTMEEFNNSSTLLSVKETVKLVQDGAYIIDIRSVKQYQKKSITNSINIDFDNITTNILEYKIKTLPITKKGFVVACFGTVSCSEAPSLGWELNRIGLPYLGTYSGGIESFHKNYYPQQSNFSSSILMYEHIKLFVIHSIQSLETFVPPSILFCILMFFLSLMLWQTKKLSYHYFHYRAMRQGNKKKLYTTYQDSDLVERENRFLIKQHVKEILNSFTPLFFVFIYSFFVGITALVFEKSSLFNIHNWFSIAQISTITIFSSIIFTIGLHLAILKKINKTAISLFILYIASFSLCLLILKDFSYIHILIFTTTFILMKFFDLFLFILKKINNIYKSRTLLYGYQDLKDSYNYIPKNTKASNLSFLMQKGFRIPSGFIVKGSHYNKLSLHSQKKIIQSLGNTFAVRSSSLNEDQADSTRAGLNLSIVPAKAENLMKNIKDVFLSYENNKKQNIISEEVVLLQQLVQPHVSGVAFSQHPQWGGVMLIEWGKGLSGKRLEGSENSEQTVIERSKGNVVFSSNNNKYLINKIEELYNTLITLENIYGYAVDIEWAIDENGLWLLQCRKQTALNILSYNNIERERLLFLTPHYIPLKECELSYSLPHCNRLSASLVCHLWEPGSSADIGSRMALWSWNQPIQQQNSYVYILGQIWQSDYILLNKPHCLNWYMSKKQYSQHYSMIKNKALHLLQRNNINLSVNWEKLSKKSWLHLWSDSLSSFKQLQSFVFYFEIMAQSAIEELTDDCRKLHINEKDFLQSKQEHLYEQSVPYRSSNDYDIASPRYIETNNNLIYLQNLEIFDEDIFIEQYKDMPLTLIKKIKFTKQLIELREIYKYYSLQVYYLMRIAVLDIQKRFNLADNVFELDFTEIPSLFSMNDLEIKKITTLLNQRVLDNQLFHQYHLPNYLNAKQFALLNRPENKHHIEDNINDNKPQFVSNPCNLTGKLIYLKEKMSLMEINALLSSYPNDNLIIYSSFISPQIVQLSTQYNIVGLCASYGSLLSHTSILAREANLPFLIHIILSPNMHGEDIKITKEGKIINN